MYLKNNSFKLPEKIIAAYSGKTILISGALGYIGSTLTQFLAGIDCNIILLDQASCSSWMPQKQKAKISISCGDVTIRQTWESLLSNVDYLFHLAALEYDRSAYNMKRDLEVSALSVLHFLEVCRENNLHPTIIFSSSANLFGMVEALPVSEKMPSNPLSFWSVHKLLAENYLQVYAKKYGIKSVILRLANVYGPTVNQDVTTNVIINRMIVKALRDKRLTLYANKNCVRDYIFLEDAVRAFLWAGTEKRLLFDSRFYIVGSGEGETIAEVWQLIADKVKAHTEKDITVELDDSIEIELFDMRNFVADTRIFREITGWKPEVFLEKGIELTIDALTSVRIRET